MKVLILGGTGMLGHRAVQVFSQRFETWASVRSSAAACAHLPFFDPARTIFEADLGSLEAVRGVLDTAKPDAVVNCIGILKLPYSPAYAAQAVALNALLPHQLELLAAETPFHLIHLSTDCVFSGLKGMYTESDTPDAEDLYGRSKLLGEVAGPNCLTLRTSMIGRELFRSGGLLEWFLSQNGQRTRGYTRAIFSGFTTRVLAELLADLLADHPDLTGLYHIAAAPINKFDLLQRITQQCGLDIQLDAYDKFVCDRSLDASALQAAISFEPPSWDKMIEDLAGEIDTYTAWRGAC